MRWFGRRPFQTCLKRHPHPAASLLPPVTTKIQVKEAGNPQYPLSSSLRGLVGNQEIISVGVRRTIIYKKGLFLYVHLYGMTLWRKMRDPESYLIKGRAVQKCVLIYRSKEILDLVARKSKRLEDTARN